jgi:hypothetical protein
MPEGTFTMVSGNGNFNCAISTEKSISCWGQDNYQQVTGVTEENVTSIHRFLKFKCIKFEIRLTFL